ncbi:MAG: HD domain-containing protein [Dehalococcoidia bacterium]|nr:HD domain-containing protein [Dehalococcoidia bacterium]
MRAYLVGGFLRDLLLGRASHDVDIAVDADALALARSLADELDGSFVLLDAVRETARVVIHHGDERTFFDIARLRGGSIEADLALRDFTVNALATDLSLAVGDPATWPLHDPHNGRADLDARLLRSVSPSAFSDDPVRTLRAVRLVAQLGFHLEAATAQHLKRDGHLVVQTAPERAREEFLQALAQPRVGQTLRLMDSMGILCALIPELAAGKDVDQPPEHYWDVFTHGVETAARVEEVLSPAHRAAEGGSPFLRTVPWPADDGWLDAHFQRELGDGHTLATFLKLAGLLHDMAKPQTKAFTPDKRMRFFGHAEQGAQEASKVLRRLRCSEQAVERLAAVIADHLRPNQMAQPGQTPTKRALYRYYRDLGDAALDTVYLCLADYLAARGPWMTEREWEQQCALMRSILPENASEASPAALPKLVDGHDLQQLFGLKPSPLFRTLLETVREAQAAGEVSTREEAFALVGTALRESAQTRKAS